MSDKQIVRISFSYPDLIKRKLEEKAKQNGRKLMGYVKLIINKEIKRVKEL